MAATERIVRSLQQSSSSAMGSSAILSIKSLHPSYYESGRSYKKQLPALQASVARKDDHGTTLRKVLEERSSSNAVSSLLKAVQEGGSNAVMQQVSSIRHFFMPELPHAIIAEIKKRMPLSFREQDDDDEEVGVQDDDLNGGLIEKHFEEQVITMGPRCAWPKLKPASAEERQEEGIRGPRCAWPRSAQVSSSSSFAQECKHEEKLSTTGGGGGGGAGGAKCAWPRAKRRDYDQNNTERPQKVCISNGFATSRSSLKNQIQKLGFSKSPQEGLVTSMNSLEGLQKEAFSKSSRDDLQKERKEEAAAAAAMVNRSVSIEGPRCAWPRSTPRRMLATGVGLSLINYVFIGQGAPALAILQIICEEESSLNPLKNLLP